MKTTDYEQPSYVDNFSKTVLQNFILFRPKYFSDGPWLDQEIGIYLMDSTIFILL